MSTENIAIREDLKNSGVYRSSSDPAIEGLIDENDDWAYQYPSTLLTNLSLPTPILLSLLPFLKNILLILQADSPLSPSHIHFFVLIQTLLNNSDYTKLTLNSFHDKSSNDMLTKIEIFAISLKLLSKRVADIEERDTEYDQNLDPLGECKNLSNFQKIYFLATSKSYRKEKELENRLRIEWSNIWEILKTKYLFLIGWESGIIDGVANGLKNIKSRLEGEVLREGWKDGNVLNTDKRSSQSSD